MFRWQFKLEPPRIWLLKQKFTSFETSNKFNILHYVLLFSCLHYPSSSDSSSARGSSNSSSSSVSTAYSVFFVCTFAQCSFASHLQYEVHDTPANWQLQLALEHCGTDLHPQATSSNNSLGATTVPWTGTGMSSAIFHPNMERLVAGGSFWSAALQISTWRRARLTCSIADLSVGGRLLIFGGSFFLLNNVNLKLLRAQTQRLLGDCAFWYQL